MMKLPSNLKRYSAFAVLLQLGMIATSFSETESSYLLEQYHYFLDNEALASVHQVYKDEISAKDELYFFLTQKALFREDLSSDEYNKFLSNENIRPIDKGVLSTTFSFKNITKARGPYLKALSKSVSGKGLYGAQAFNQTCQLYLWRVLAQVQTQASVEENTKAIQWYKKLYEGTAELPFISFQEYLWNEFPLLDDDEAKNKAFSESFKANEEVLMEFCGSVFSKVVDQWTEEELKIGAPTDNRQIEVRPKKKHKAERHQHLKCPSAGIDGCTNHDDQGFFNQRILNDHWRRVHEREELLCGIKGCRDTFGTERGLSDHRKRMHDDENLNRIWICNVPGCKNEEGFVRESELKRHQRIHQKSFYCFIQGCKREGKPFGTQKELDRHNEAIHAKNPKEKRKKLQ